MSTIFFVVKPEHAVGCEAVSAAVVSHKLPREVGRMGGW